MWSLNRRESTLKWSLNPALIDHAWDGDVDPLSSVLEALAALKSVGVESGTGTGKTFLGACIVLWFLACFEDSIVVTAAPEAGPAQAPYLEGDWPPLAALLQAFPVRHVAGWKDPDEARG